MVPRFLPAACLALALAAGARGQKVTLPAEVKTPLGRLASVAVEYDGDDVKWDVPPQLDCFREYDPDPKKVRLRVMGHTAGAYRLLAVTAKGGKLSEFAVCTVVVGEAPPVPPGPTPPVPPGPTPPVPPVPVPTGFRVIIINESGSVSSLPKEQVAIFTSGVIREYLNLKCVRGPDGRTPEWRVWDKDVNTANESDTLQKLWAAVKPQVKTLPAIAIVTDAKGEVFPLPATVDETMALLRKHGG